MTNSQILKSLISKEVDRLAVDHSEENIFLINNVLKRMLLFIDDHDRMVNEITRIGGKHAL
tara:strand:+ start:2156 stop:2338 length:183 start_codon:yes stop_codon:yes gene_type:complete